MNISKESTPAKLRKAAPAEACALEKLPHITKRVCLLWGHPEFDAFTSHLMMDSRDGKRQGLPWDVAEEIQEQSPGASRTWPRSAAASKS